MTRWRLGMVGSIVTALVLSGCATGPVYPLMTPLRVAQSFGYDEHPVGEGKYEVTYVAPQQNAIGFRYDLSPTERAQKDLAFDLASLRAAELAQQSGWKGFDITDRHASTDSQFYDPWGYDDWWGPGWGWGGGRGFHRHYFGFNDWYQPPERLVQAEVRLTVSFVNDIKPGNYDAANVIQQVSSRYPGVLTAPPAAAGAAPTSAPVPPPPAPAAKPTA